MADPVPIARLRFGGLRVVGGYAFSLCELAKCIGVGFLRICFAKSQVSFQRLVEADTGAKFISLQKDVGHHSKRNSFWCYAIQWPYAHSELSDSGKRSIDFQTTCCLQNPIHNRSQFTSLDFSRIAWGYKQERIKKNVAYSGHQTSICEVDLT